LGLLLGLFFLLALLALDSLAILAVKLFLQAARRLLAFKLCEPLLFLQGGELCSLAVGTGGEHRLTLLLARLVLPVSRTGLGFELVQERLLGIHCRPLAVFKLWVSKAHLSATPSSASFARTRVAPLAKGSRATT